MKPQPGELITGYFGKVSGYYSFGTVTHFYFHEGGRPTVSYCGRVPNEDLIYEPCSNSVYAFRGVCQRCLAKALREGVDVGGL